MYYISPSQPLRLRVLAMIFDKLIQQIDSIDQTARNDTARAVNVGLTLRNWVIGFYISYYEL